MVRGLPPSAKAKEVHDHFNGLYDLSKPDWTFEVRQRAVADVFTLPPLPLTVDVMGSCMAGLLLLHQAQD